MKRSVLILGAVLFLVAQMLIAPSPSLANDAWSGLFDIVPQAGLDNEEFPDPFGGEPMDEAALEEALEGYLTMIYIGSLIGLVLGIFILYLFYSAAASIPEEHQQISPPMVWLMLIPVVGIVMMFFVYPGIAKGFQSYFASQNRTDVGDCGANMAMWFIITAFICPPANLILLFLLLFKFRDLASQIPQGGGA